MNLKKLLVYFIDDENHAYLYWQYFIDYIDVMEMILWH